MMADISMHAPTACIIRAEAVAGVWQVLEVADLHVQTATLQDVDAASQSPEVASLQVQKSNEGKAIALCETLLGVGTMFGASIGGILYSQGGFPLPFWVCGGSQLALLFPCILFLRDIDRSYTSLEAELETGWVPVLKAAGIPITCFALCLAGTSWSWYQVRR